MLRQAAELLCVSELWQAPVAEVRRVVELRLLRSAELPRANEMSNVQLRAAALRVIELEAVIPSAVELRTAARRAVELHAAELRVSRLRAVALGDIERRSVALGLCAVELRSGRRLCYGARSCYKRGR